MKKIFFLSRSLRLRLIISVVTIEVIMLSILVWNNMSIIHATHTDRLRDTANSMIQQIANTAGNYMVAVDYASLEDYLSNIIHYKELAYLIITDRDNKPVISLGTSIPNNFASIDTHPGKVTDGIFDIRQPIKVAGQPMGHVLMGFSLSLMDDAIFKSRNRGITIAVIEIILTIIVTVLIGLGLTRRLSLLGKAAAQVEAGNYSVSVPTETCDEVGKTAAAFNRMVTEVSNRSHQLQQEQKITRALLDENRYLIQQSLEVQEEERKHLARELHDELGQCLTAIQADAGSIKDLATDADQRITTSAVAIIDVSSHVYNVVHSMMHRLRPGILDNLGLEEAIKDEVDAWNHRNQPTRCTTSFSGDLSHLGERINITVYRIIQEALTNIAKHAHATKVEIQLIKQTQGLNLVIIDNGKGIPSTSTQHGLGLIGVRERVQALEGTFEIHSSASGLKLTIVIP